MSHRYLGFQLTLISYFSKLPIHYFVLCVISVHRQGPNLGSGEAKVILEYPREDIGWSQILWCNCGQILFRF